MNTTATSDQITRTLNEQFKLPHFLPLQKKVIEHLLAQKSAMVIMPTGSGKSLTYQLPALLLPGTALVLSPLKALMKDQVDKLKQLGIHASFLNSDLRKDEREKRTEKFSKGEYKLFYVTPERFTKPEFLAAIEPINISLLVVDEAHCISQWGHDFRPEYAKVGQLQQKLLKNSPQMITCALTATATPEVKADIIKTLQLETHQTFALPIARPNLAPSVIDLYGEEQKLEHLMRILKQNSASSIIYFSLISTLMKFSESLKKNKIFHECYHGDLPDNQKRRAQENFLTDKSQIILATPAFGLGIDKPDVRSVVHVELPGSVEAYFQEIGRAGRDGHPANATLLYDQDDVSTQMEFIKWANPEAAFIERVLKLIEKNQARVRQEGADYLRAELNFYNKRDFRVETALNLLRSWGALEEWTVVETDLTPWLSENERTLKLRRQNEKLLRLVQYIGTDACRMKFIYNYFNPGDYPDCGVCDNCMNLAPSRGSE